MTYEFDTSEYDDPVNENDDYDDGMAEFWKTDGIPAEALLRLTYEDSSGQSSERLFETRLFTAPDSTFSILGHCHTRNAERTLRIDRITHCIDERTSKTVGDVYEYLFDLYRETPTYSLDNVLADNTDKLRALLYVMRYSGHQEHQRTQVITALARRWSDDSRISTAMTVPFFMRHRMESIEAFRMMAGRLNKALSAQEKADFIKLATKLATQFEATNSYSQEALDYMAKRFAKSE